jgi:hypothetical protein
MECLDPPFEIVRWGATGSCTPGQFIDAFGDEKRFRFTIAPLDAEIESLAYRERLRPLAALIAMRDGHEVRFLDSERYTFSKPNGQLDGIVYCFEGLCDDEMETVKTVAMTSDAFIAKYREKTFVKVEP